MNLQDLKKPFPEKDIEWRIGQSGKSNGKIWAHCLAYISARAIQDRLDEVFGACGWKVTYSKLDIGIIAKIEVMYGNEWIGKEDGAEQTDIEAFKGGLSSALKRAGSAWGIGRYLYDLEAGFAEITEKGNGSRYAKLHEKHGGDVFYWKPPRLPDWALPETNKNEKPLSAKQVPSDLPNRAPGADPKPTSSIVLPQTNRWADYTIKSDKYNKDKTLKQVGLPWVMKQLEYWTGKELKSKGLKDDVAAFNGFVQEATEANIPKVFTGNVPPPPTTDYKEPRWDEEEMPKFDSDENL